MRMRNFVTYTDTTFRMKPGLNLIMGPNGTGKSTLVCALALGLGGKPETLGRGKLNEFVKQGTSEALIEIEIKGQGSENDVIRRTIKTNGGGSWEVNGQPVSVAEARQVVDRYNIQVDNLCQFLPQEKVAEFARESPQNRLRSIERAICSDGMVAKHDRLIDISRQLAEHETNRESDRKELDMLRARHEEAERQIQRIEDYQRNEQELQDLKTLAGVVELEEMTALRQQLSQQLKDVEREIAEKLGRREALRPLRENAVSKLNEIDTNMSKTNTARVSQASEVESIKEQLATLTRQLSQLREVPEALRQRQKTYQDELQMLENRIAVSKQKRDEASNRLISEEEVAATVAARTETKNELRACSTQRNATADQKGPLEELFREAKRKTEYARSQLRQFDNKDEQKLQDMQTFFKDRGRATANAIRFIRDNQHLFKDKVYEPPVMSLSVIDKDCSKQLNTAGNADAMLMFTCVNKDDYVTFGREVVDKHGFNVNYFNSANLPQTVADMPRKFTAEFMQRVGFDGSIIDLLEGPEPVRVMLCNQIGLHQIPYCKGNMSDNAEQELRSRGFVGRVIDRSGQLNLSKSQYGHKQVLVVTTRHAPQLSAWMKLLVNAVDPEKLASLEAEVEQYTREANEHARKLREIDEASAPLREQMQELRKKLDDVEAKLKDRQHWSKKLGEYSVKTEQFEEQLRQKMADPPEIDSELESNEASIRQVVSKIETTAASLRASFERVVDQTSEIADLQLAERCYQNEQELLKIMIEAGTEELREQRDDIKRRGRELVDKIKAAKVALRRQHSVEELTELQARASKYTLEQIEQEISKLEAELELANRVNNAELVLSEHRRRGERIAELERKLSSGEDTVEELTRQLRELREPWEAELSARINDVSVEFSQLFAKAGLRGDVVINKTGDDFKNWSLDIRVSFRKDAPLQVLNAQTQSGGERSTATSLFMMSLQKFTKAPFRVVDEINQGMDSNNERMIHRRMVEVACDNASQAQYFLVTPKLLMNLHYHPKMSVSCIFSGPKVSKNNALVFDTTAMLARLSEAA